MKHLGLFEGIGGFSLAARWMGWETVAWCEWDEKCQKVLKRHFPEAIGHGNIKETDFTVYANTIHILTGGFPCQPYSLAGKRKGTDDDRHLWPEMLRAIREVRPRWIVGENVYGLVNWSGGLVFEQVCLDLENEGYKVLPVILPACGVNAPHKRDRIWFIAYSDKWGGSKHELSAGREVLKERINPSGNDSNASNSRTEGLRSKWENSIYGSENTTNTNDQGLQRSENKGETKGERPHPEQQSTGLLCPGWEDFPTQSPLCGGNDGIPNRVDRIKQLGNAIVPQISLQIFKTIAEYESI